MLYVGLCVMMLYISQPQSAIEPVSSATAGQRLLINRVRAPKAFQPVRGERLSHMTTLLHSHMFTEQGIKLKWIKERISRCIDELMIILKRNEVETKLFINNFL